MTAIQYGLLATTLDSGAGSRYLSKYNKVFKGRYVRIWADNDISGKEYAYRIAREIIQIAEWVKIVTIPGIKIKEDFSDWIAQMKSQRKDKKQIEAEIKRVAKYSKKLTEKQVQWEITKLEIVVELNRQYKFIRSSEQNNILRITPDKNTGHNRYKAQPLAKMRANFANKNVCNPTIERGQKGHVQNKFDIWYKHPFREEYEDVIYKPLNPLHMGNIHTFGDSKFLNVFEGWPHAPIKGRWKKCKRFFFEVVCNGDEEKFKWLLGRIASIIQDPCGARIETFIAIIGDMGTGKSFFIQLVNELFGKNAIYAIGSDIFLSKFKEHLVDKILVCADETKIETESEMKIIRGLTSAKKIAIEAKYKSITEEDNWVNLIIACNEIDIIRAAPGERRAAIFKLSNKYRNDRKYFKGIKKELDNGGYEAMMYDLLHRKISDVNLHEPPFADELFQIKDINKPSIDDFIISRINRNSLIGNDIHFEKLYGLINEKYGWEIDEDLYGTYKKWPKTPVVTEVFHELYLIHCEKNDEDPSVKTILIRELSNTHKPILIPNGNKHRVPVEMNDGSKFRKRTVSFSSKLDAKKAIMRKYNLKWKTNKANVMWKKTFGSQL